MAQQRVHNAAPYFVPSFVLWPATMLSCALALVSLVLAASSQPPCDGSGDSALPRPPSIRLSQVNLTALRVHWQGGTFQVIISHRPSGSMSVLVNVTVPANPDANLIATDLTSLCKETEYEVTARSVGADGCPGPASPPVFLSTPIIQRFIPVGVTAEVPTRSVEGTDEGLSEPIRLLVAGGFLFGETHHSMAYVSRNGYVSFGQRVVDRTPKPFPNGHPSLVAPFWAESEESAIDQRPVRYEQHTDARDEAPLSRVSAFIRDRQDGEGAPFSGTWLMVVEWRELQEAGASVSTKQNNTFQLLIITNGSSSFVVFLYHCDLVQWGQPAVIGYSTSAKLNSFANHPLSNTLEATDIDCINKEEDAWSQILYQVARGVDECASGLHTCHESAMCTDTVSGFVCTCREQLTGDGHTHCSPVPTPEASEAPLGRHSPALVAGVVSAGLLLLLLLMAIALVAWRWKTGIVQNAARPAKASAMETQEEHIYDYIMDNQSDVQSTKLDTDLSSGSHGGEGELASDGARAVWATDHGDLEGELASDGAGEDPAGELAGGAGEGKVGREEERSCDGLEAARDEDCGAGCGGKPATVGAGFEQVHFSYEAVEDSYEAVEDCYEAVEDSYEAVEDCYEAVEDSYEGVEDCYEAVEDSYEAVEHDGCEELEASQEVAEEEEGGRGVIV